MKLLLDTHALIWWDQKPGELSHKALDAIKLPGAEVYFSIASVWEMQLKQVSGKLKLGGPVRMTIETQMKENGLRLLPLALSHIWSLTELPNPNRDPFDRILASQARSEGMTLITRDTIFKKYRVDLLW
jgi:PIN domain nuclease of toxin-antitoxin system